VRVIGHYMGGGFGSKLEPGKYTLAAALLARQTGRPVKLFLSREESFLCVGNRPPNLLTLKAGAKKDGTLTALQLTGLGTGGAYPEGTSAGYLVSDLYTCPNVKTEETSVYVNAGKARAFRAPGFPQGAWALEQTMDALARNIDVLPEHARSHEVATWLAPDQADGEQAMWVDGRQVGRFTGIRWRNDSELKVNALWLENYGYDPGDPTRQYWGDQQAVWFDNIVVAKRYIGPIKEPGGSR
jgi:hypothetical protein